MQKITSVAGRAVYVPGNDIDTDRIIPARFMKCITFDGLGEFLFYDVRKNADGTDKPHPLNDPRFKGFDDPLLGRQLRLRLLPRARPPRRSRKLRPSRRSSPRTLPKSSLATARLWGMPCMTAAREDIAKIAAAIEADPSLPVTLDIVAQEIRYGSHVVKAQVRASDRDCLDQRAVGRDRANSWTARRTSRRPRPS